MTEPINPDLRSTIAEAYRRGAGQPIFPPALDAITEAVTAARTALTASQLNEAVQALHARLDETRHYLRPAAAFTSGHADCCDVARAKAAVLAEQRRGLEQREEHVLGALRVLDPKPEEHR